MLSIVAFAFALNTRSIPPPKRIDIHSLAQPVYEMERGGRVLTGEECLARRGGRSPAAPLTPRGRQPGWRARFKVPEGVSSGFGVAGTFLPKNPVCMFLSFFHALLSGNRPLAVFSDVKSLQGGRLMDRFEANRSEKNL